MIVCAPIPENYIADLLRIDVASNLYPWSAENLRSSYYQFQHLGLFQGTRLIAYLIFQQTDDEAEIIHFICDKTHQRQGFAYQLLTQWLDQLAQQSVNKVFLEVRSGNQRAKQLYTQVGFVEVGRRESYYSNKDDAIIMRLNKLKIV